MRRRTSNRFVLSQEVLEERLNFAGDIAGVYRASAEVFNLNTDPTGGFVHATTLHNNELYYNANTTDGNVELWQTDGSSIGTKLIKSIPAGQTGSFKRSGWDIESVGEKVYFTVSNRSRTDIAPGSCEPPGQASLWASDGTEMGTEQLTVLGGVGGCDLKSYTAHLYEADDELIGFGWETFGSGGFVNHLLVSDGTQAGTSSQSLSIRNYRSPMAELNGEWFVLAANAIPESGGLWKLTPGEAPSLVKSFEFNAFLGPWPRGLTEVNGSLYMAGVGDESGSELWTSDGTTEGTRLVVDALPGPRDGVRNVFQMATGQNELHFLARNQASIETDIVAESNYSLWKSDGTENGTALVGDAFTGIVERFAGGDEGVSYFEVDSSPERNLVKWSSKGFENIFNISSNVPAGRLLSFVDPLLIAGQSLFFRTEPTGDSRLSSLWFHEHETGETTQIGNGFQFVGEVNDKLLVNRFGQLFHWDPETKNLSPLQGEGTSTMGTQPRAIAASDSKLFFYSSVDGQFYSFDPIDASNAVETIASPFALSEWQANAMQSTVVGNYLLVALDNGVWGMDITTHAWAQIVDARIDLEKLEFIHGEESGLVHISAGVSKFASKWKTDGTLDGTEGTKELPLSDFELPGDMEWTHRDWAATNDVAFVVRSQGPVYELWTSDGSREPTKLLDFGSANHDYNETLEVAAVNGAIYVAEAVTGKGANLWKYDGQSNEISHVARFPMTQMFPRELVEADGKLFFSAGTAETGRELWVSDGTTEGTQLAADVFEGTLSSNPTNLTVWNDKLYFAANDFIHGEEIWSIDLALSEPLIGDADSNGSVDFLDFLILAANFGTHTGTGAMSGDFDEDGEVNFVDFLALAENFGRELTSLQSQSS